MNDLNELKRAALFNLLVDTQNTARSLKVPIILVGSALVGIVRDNELINAESVFDVRHFDIENKYAALSKKMRERGYDTSRKRGGKSKLIISDRDNGVRVQIRSFYKSSNMRDVYFRKKRPGEVRIVPRKFYDNFGSIIFNGYRFTCPSDAQKYLEYIYIDYTTPAEVYDLGHRGVRSPEYMGVDRGFPEWTTKNKGKKNVIE